MFKRFLAMLLSLSFLLSASCVLTGCSDEESDTISKGDTLALIEDCFGMYDYSTATPFTKTVGNDSSYFDTVQIAFEWGLTDDENIDVESAATKGFLAQALVKCVDLTDVSAMTPDDILEYAVNNGYVSFEYRGRTDSIRNVTRKEVDESIAKSYVRWTDRQLEQHEEVKYSDEVKNFISEGLTQDEFSVDESTDTVVLPASQVSELKQGDTFVLPAKEGVSSVKAYKAEDVEIQGDKAIVRTSEASVDTAIENLDVSGTITPDLTSCNIIDGAGNVIPADDAVAEPQMNVGEAYPELLSDTMDDAQNAALAKISRSIKFEMDGLKINGTVSNDSVSVNLTGDIYANKQNGIKVAVNKSYEIKDIAFDYDYKIDWFKLKYAYAKLSYKTVDKSSLDVSYKKTLVAAPKYSNGNGHFLSNFTRSIIKDSQAKGAKTIKICSIPIVSGGVVSFNLDIKIKISVSGKIELSVTTSSVNGIEYKNGKLRYIKEDSKDTNLTLNGKAELTLYLGCSFKALGINVVGLGIEGGIGCSATLTAHLADSSGKLLDEISLNGNTKLVEDSLSDLNGAQISTDTGGTIDTKCDICFDWSTYGILKFTMDSECTVAKLTGASLNIEILGSSNAKIKPLCGHIENGVKVPECTRKYNNGEESNSSVTDSTGISDSISAGSQNESNIGNNYEEILDIDVYFVNLAPGEAYKLEAVDIPRGYSKSDVVFSSSDANVATVSSDGTITAVSGGDAEITAKTSDGKYSISCSVHIAENKIEFTPLNIDFSTSSAA
ncbi:MAG: Ig-like domain-containing protein [Ruminiclostridium sp.]